MALQKLSLRHQDADFSHGLGRNGPPLPGMLEDGIRYYKHGIGCAVWLPSHRGFRLWRTRRGGRIQSRAYAVRHAEPGCIWFETPEAVKAAFDQAVASGEIVCRNRRSATWRDPIGCTPRTFDCRLVERRRLRPGGYFPAPIRQAVHSGRAHIEASPPAAEDHFLNRRFHRQACTNALDRFLSRQFNGIAIDARADAGKRNRNKRPVLRQSLCTGDSSWTASPAPRYHRPPYRPHRMNDVLRGQTIGLGHLGLAGLAATQQPAFMHQVWPAARWIAPSTPPPPSNEEFAALTMAST